MPTTYGYALLIALAHAQYLGYAVASRVHLPECVNTHIPQTYGSARYADVHVVRTNAIRQQNHDIREQFFCPKSKKI